MTKYMDAENPAEELTRKFVARLGAARLIPSEAGDQNHSGALGRGRRRLTWIRSYR